MYNVIRGQCIATCDASVRCAYHVHLHVEIGYPILVSLGDGGDDGADAVAELTTLVGVRSAFILYLLRTNITHEKVSDVTFAAGQRLNTFTNKHSGVWGDTDRVGGTDISVAIISSVYV